MDESTFSGDELYKRSHGTYGVGEQKRRDYQWNVNPQEFRFGLRGNTVAFNGVSKNVAEILTSPGESEGMIGTKKVEERYKQGDRLGKIRDLGMGSTSRAEQFVYGLPSSYSKRGRPLHGAAELIRGTYFSAEEPADDDLGKSVTPGFRNIAEDVRPICSSIRIHVIILLFRAGSTAAPRSAPISLLLPAAR